MKKKLFIVFTIALILVSGSVWMHLSTLDTFRDSQTGLVWQDDKDAKNKRLTWKESKKYCQNLSLVLKEDWRVPTVRELQTIVNLKKINPAIKDGFENVVPGKYWASEYVKGTNLGYLVYFQHGDTGKYPKTAKLGIRCVRGEVNF